MRPILEYGYIRAWPKAEALFQEIGKGQQRKLYLLIVLNLFGFIIFLFQRTPEMVKSKEFSGLY